MSIAISDAEKIILDALWAESPLTAEQIVDRVAAANGWEPTTVRTLLNRLMKKEAIAAERVERKYHYRPLIERSTFLKSESQAFLGRLFDGKLASFVSHFAEDRQLGAKDIEALKKLIKEAESD
jgi:predicted transcriptional regulator